MARIDTKTPKMFSDETFEEKLTKVQKISDLKNLGPSTEKSMHKAGIKTVNQFIKLGWKKSLIKMIKINPKNRHTLFAYALIGALRNKDAFHITDQEKQEAKDFCAQLKPKKSKK